MNIFVLDVCPATAAELQCDKHVVKMCLETAQLLCSPHAQGIAPYRRTHYNHPCAIWARTAFENYAWLVRHGAALCREYTHRYGKTHASERVVDWCHLQTHTLTFPWNDRTPFVQCMPDEYRGANAVAAYRRYYNAEKARIATWTRRDVPSWFRGEACL